jgi:hypothetical protein
VGWSFWLGRATSKALRACDLAILWHGGIIFTMKKDALTQKSRAPYPFKLKWLICHDGDARNGRDFQIVE